MLKPSLRDDRGSSIVSVLITMLVLTLFATLVAAVVMATTRTLVVGRATTQSRQAADAGLATALAAFKRTTDCSQAGVTSEPTSSDPSAPDYTVTCAVAGEQVTFVSTGSAPGSADARVQATYKFEIAEIEGDIGDITLFSGATFTAETDTETTDGLLRITMAKGNFTCQNAVEANLVIAGDFWSNGSCDVKGDLWTGGTIGGSSGGDRIRGSATSAGSGTNSYAGSVDGDFFAAGDVTLGWPADTKVKGSLKSAGNVQLNNNLITKNVTVPSSKTLKTNSAANVPAGSHAQVGGQVFRPGSVTPPGAPSYVEWRDYDFLASDFAGYAHRVLTPAQCSTFNSWPSSGWTALAAIETPTIIDARACSELNSNSGGVDITVKTNLVFVAKAFNLTTFTMKPSSSGLKAWFIVPDTNDNNEPLGNCWSGGTISLNHTYITVPSLLYTPGCVQVSGGGVLHGTIYSGGFGYGGQINMTGVRVPIPGSASGTPGGGGGAGGLTMTKISQRDLR